MATIKIYNDIQTENEKKVAAFWGEAEGVCYKDIDPDVSRWTSDTVPGNVKAEISITSNPLPSGMTSRSA